MTFLKPLLLTMVLALLACAQTPIPIPNPPPPKVSTIQKDTIPVAGIPAAQPTLTATLTKTPAPGGQIHVVFQGVSLNYTWWGVFDITGADPKILNITLPTVRPFGANDVIVVSYPTLE